MPIEAIDPNFRMESIDGHELAFLDVARAPFHLTGFPFFAGEREFCRLPKAEIPAMNSGVQGLAWHTAGGMVRFRSDSPCVAVQAELRAPGSMNHMPRSGSSGVDLYVGQGRAKRFRKTAIPGPGVKEYSALLFTGDAGMMREFTLNFPLYNGVRSLRVGISPKAQMMAPSPFAIEQPILFYGSSITQGGCASRPGNAYAHILARWFDANLVNYGFSGSARAEQEMARLVARIPQSVFVYDYDHNAPNVKHLADTHVPFFRTIRQARPDLPVVMVSRPDFDGNLAESRARREIIRTTYEQAKANGDKQVFFVDGETLFGTADRDACTVDGCHPNDLGFMRMAEAIRPTLAKALGGMGE
jgi:lysophospholipase L1-like esterase